MNKEQLFSKLNLIGMSDWFHGFVLDTDLDEFTVGRVTQEHRERYTVYDGDNEYDAEITGNLRFTANSRSGFPAVGDWVIIKTYNTDQAIIHKVLPRKSVLSRRAVGKFAEEQIISANVDVAFIVQSFDNNFNINRLERYLSVCYSSGIDPVLIISKTDLSTVEEIRNAVEKIGKRNNRVKYFLLSNITGEGLEELLSSIEKGKTYCVVGSSGVGKSTLINNLLQKNILKTGQISQSTNKGKHITEHRELIVLDNGGVIIDNPGMREFGLTDDEVGIQTAFREIIELTSKCRFPDCTHSNETDCAVKEAVKKGIIDSQAFENYLKMEREQEHYRTSAVEKRRKDKIFGKIIKNYFKEAKRNNL